MQVPGYSDSQRLRPNELLTFWTLDLDFDEISTNMGLRSPEFVHGRVHVHDCKSPNGATPRDQVYREVQDALAVLRTHVNEASDVVLTWPRGRPGAEHVVGGTWIAKGVSFFAARNRDTGRVHLCAKVY